MPKYECVSIDKSGSILGSASTINAASFEEAAEMFIANKRENGFSVEKVRVDDGELSYNFSAGEATGITTQDNEMQSSLTPTDILLKELIQHQIESNELLAKIRWSLLVIHIIMVLWFVSGWVFKPI